MSAKKTTISELQEELDRLTQDNMELSKENIELHEEFKRLVSSNVQMEDRYNAEHKARMRERDEASKKQAVLEERINYLTTSVEACREQRAVEKSKRHGSIPKFVIVAAVSMVVMMTAFMLQKLSAIGPSVGFGIQTGTAMVIAWCYAIIWDRSRK